MVTRNPIVPDVVMIELLWTQAGIPCANILHASYEGTAPTATDCADLASSIATNLWPEGLYEAYPTSTVLVGVRVTDLASDTGAVGEHSVGQAGTFEGGELPAQACVLVNFAQTRRYRGGHPRMYFLPPNQSLLAGPSEWDSTILTELGAVMATLATVLAGADYSGGSLSGQVCVSYRTGNNWRVDNLVEPVTGLVVSPIMATQRRRIRASSY